MDLEKILELMAERGWDTFIDEVSGIEEYTETLLNVIEEYENE